MIQEVMPELYRPLMPQVMQPEQPETAVARGDPETGAELLKYISRTKAEVEIHRNATVAVSNFMNRASTQRVDSMWGYETKIRESPECFSSLFGRSTTISVRF